MKFKGEEDTSTLQSKFIKKCDNQNSIHTVRSGFSQIKSNHALYIVNRAKTRALMKSDKMKKSNSGLMKTQHLFPQAYGHSLRLTCTLDTNV